MFKKIEHSGLNEVVYEQIKEKINANELTPGTRLDVDVLAADLGVSKTPVTNAIKSLAKDGYVVINPRSGTYIRSYSREEVDSIFDFRYALERMALKKCIPLADKGVLASIQNKLEDIKEKMLKETQVNEALMADFFETEVGIHEYIISLCPAIISDQIQNLIHLTKRLRKIQLSTQIEEKGPAFFCEGEIELHLELVRAIIAEEERLAIACLREDILGTKYEILEKYGEETGGVL